MTPQTWSSSWGEQAAGTFLSRRKNLQRGPFTFLHLQSLEGEPEVYPGSLRPVNPAGEVRVWSGHMNPSVMGNGNVEISKRHQKKRKKIFFSDFFFIQGTYVDLENRKKHSNFPFFKSTNKQNLDSFFPFSKLNRK